MVEHVENICRAFAVEAGSVCDSRLHGHGRGRCACGEGLHGHAPVHRAHVPRALRGSGTTDRVATDRVIVALGLEKDNSNGISAAISRCGVTAIGPAL